MALTELLLIRHGESVGNVAREAAEAAGAEQLSLDQRDPDVVLSERGEQQARAAGRRLGELATDGLALQVWSSPYVRAACTASIAMAESGLDAAIHLDERLRDRELGQLDGLTRRGVKNRFAGEDERRRRLGKVYYRPPCGESWADVALRLRSFLGEIDAAGRPGRVVIMTHDAVIMLIRYVLEQLTERQLLDLAAEVTVGNASISRVARTAAGGPWHVEEFGTVEHLERFGVEATEHGAERDAHPH